MKTTHLLTGPYTTHTLTRDDGACVEYMVYDTGAVYILPIGLPTMGWAVGVGEAREIWKQHIAAGMKHTGTCRPPRFAAAA